MITAIVLLLMGMCASFASCFLKKATENCKSILGIIKQPLLYAGMGLYVLSALLNIYLLKVLPYSVVVPLGSLTYIWTLFISNKLLGERIAKHQVIGIAVILVGVSFIAWQ